MLYRVEFQIAHGGFYYSGMFDDIRDAENLRTDIRGTGGHVRFLRIEQSRDGGETWEPHRENLWSKLG